MQVYTFHFKKIQLAVGSKKYLCYHEPIQRKFLTHLHHKMFFYNILQKVIKTSKKISSEGTILWLTIKTHKDTANLFIF